MIKQKTIIKNFFSLFVFVGLVISVLYMFPRISLAQSCCIPAPEIPPPCSGDYDGCGSMCCCTNTCAKPSCKAITATPSPAPAGSVVALTTTTGGDTYTWSTNGGTCSNQRNTNWTVPGTAGTYTATLRACNSYGCSNCPKSITVNATTATCNTGIVYVEGSVGEKIRFTKNFTTDGNPMLIITNVPVEVANTVGVASGATNPPFTFPITKTPDIEAAIISSNTITIEGGQNNDSAIMLQGPLVSKSLIYFNRDLKLQNTKTPAEAIKYDPRFLAEATKMERIHPEYKSYTGLGLFSVQWNYSE
jgi:hypothetical protein